LSGGDGLPAGARTLSGGSMTAAPIVKRPPDWADLTHVEDWIFDLDNTLYPASSNLFAQVSDRMGRYIERELGLVGDQAKAEQKRLFHAHGTTLRGLMSEHGIDPHAFLAYVHDIDVSMIAPNPDLADAIGGLPGRKIIFTNGSTKHAERILAQLGLAGRFDGITDIVASDFTPKPRRAAYDSLIARHAIRADRAVLVEDMVVNLAPAHALGMTTVWVRSGYGVGGDGDRAEHVHHIIDDVADWLADLSANRPSVG
jgi:putative hydrolase of the HAD superfamily